MPRGQAPRYRREECLLTTNPHGLGPHALGECRRGPYKWSDLAPATQLSDMRVRNAYTDDDLTTVVALLYPKEPKA